MSSRKPTKHGNGLTRLSIIALLGLAAFASLVLVANPFAVHTSGVSIIPTTSNSPSTVSSGQSTQGSGAGLGSLLTGTPTSTQSGGHHHHHDGGNSTTDS